MKLKQRLVIGLFALLLSGIASGVVNAKPASGAQPLAADAPPAANVFNLLWQQAKNEFNYDGALESLDVTKGTGLESRGYRPAPGERTIQGQVDAATQAGNPTVQRGGQDLFRLRSSGHGQAGATT